MSFPHTSPNDLTVGGAYIAYCRKRMTDEYLPRVEKCLEVLTEDDVWWRAHETDNSIGNLLLHLSGNIRQWIVGGLGGVPGERDRDREFSERDRIPKERLLEIFRGVLQEADTVLANFDEAKLLEVRTIQKYEATCLDAMSHVVEHFSQHLGQIIYITKLRTAADLKFWNL